MTLRRSLLVCGILLGPTLDVYPQATAVAPAARRAITVADVDRIAVVRDPQRSPDGTWVAYAVSTVDDAKDSTDNDIWMVRWDGQDRVRLTSSPESESSPQWSPNGQWLAFLRPDDKKKGQVWLLNRLGGEAQKLTEQSGGVSDYAWSPDGTQLVLVSRDADPDAPDPDAKPAKAPKPIEIETFKFKRDGVGYVDGRLRTHLYLLHVATKSATTLTAGAYDDTEPSWSPDGQHIAFLSSRSDDRERTTRREVYVVEAQVADRGSRIADHTRPEPAGVGARHAVPVPPAATPTPKVVSTHAGRHTGPIVWSPDSSQLLYLQGGDPKYDAYEQYQLTIVPALGGAARILAGALDRPVSAPVWSADGLRITFIVNDDREQYVATVPAAGGAVTRVTSGPQVVTSPAGSPADAHLAVLHSTPTQPAEVYALEGTRLRPLTSHNAWMSELQMSTVRAVEFTTKDGVRIGGLLTTPPGTDGRTKLPFVLQIHGGPNSQDSYGFFFDREWLAANGYAVLQVNYRGSHGRGQAFQSAIYGDWGNKEVVDLLAGVDWAIREGIADPDRLGIGGWSYGGILTNYTIATDPRFKAAVSGAGSSLQLTMYGTDQYIVQYETEMGAPWKTFDRWMKVSYPFFKVEQIRTPTLFMTGEKDFNVPAIGSEQMYQAFKSTGIPTRLIVYPGQFHGITRPSYRRHRLEQWVAWFDRYVKPATVSKPPTASQP